MPLLEVAATALAQFTRQTSLKTPKRRPKHKYYQLLFYCVFDAGRF